MTSSSDLLLRTICRNGVVSMLGMTNTQLIAQGLVILGTVIVVIGMQLKKYGHIVLCKIINEFLAAVHYLLLGGYTGMAANFASCVTNGVYWYRIKNGKSTVVFQIIFGAIFVVIGALSWHGPVSLFVIAAKLISSVSLGIKNPKIIRILNLISNPCWMGYNLFMGSYAAMLTDVAITTATLVAFLRIDVFGTEKAKNTAH